MNMGTIIEAYMGKFRDFYRDPQPIVVVSIILCQHPYITPHSPTLLFSTSKESETTDALLRYIPAENVPKAGSGRTTQVPNSPCRV